MLAKMCYLNKPFRGPKITIVPLNPPNGEYNTVDEHTNQHIKNYQADTSRPVVLSKDAVTYGVAKELVNILRPLVGQSPLHFTNTQEFVEQVKKHQIGEGECITSYDIKPLVTSILMDKTITIIRKN